jgi:hypothetical protein
LLAAGGADDVVVPACCAGLAAPGAEGTVVPTAAGGFGACGTTGTPVLCALATAAVSHSAAAATEIALSGSTPQGARMAGTPRVAASHVPCCQLSLPRHSAAVET